jgi:dihydroneopterin aldolase
MSKEKIGTIRLRGLSAVGRHGVSEDERREGQRFEVDLTLTVLWPTADDLAQTVDYAVVADEVTQILTGEPVNLIETLADRIAEKVLEHEVVQAVNVVVHKPQAPIRQEFGDIYVTVTRMRGLT